MMTSARWLSSRIAVVAGIFLLMSITGVVANAQHGGWHTASFVPMFQHSTSHVVADKHNNSSGGDENNGNGKGKGNGDGDDKNGKKDNNCDPDDRVDQNGYQQNCHANQGGHGHGHGNGNGDDDNQGNDDDQGNGNGNGHGNGNGNGHGHGEGHGGDD
jgi:hypothetical protein